MELIISRYRLNIISNTALTISFSSLENKALSGMWASSYWVRHDCYCTNQPTACKVGLSSGLSAGCEQLALSGYRSTGLILRLSLEHLVL